MKSDGPLGNRKAQPNSTGKAAASVIQTIKRLEEFSQSIVGNTRPAVADLEHGFHLFRSTITLQFDLHRTPLLGVPDSIPHHVLNRTVQQGCVAAHSPVAV